MPQNLGALHFIGIGGIGMSGIAEILKTLGYEIQGSDLSADSSNVSRLKNLGIRVFQGHEDTHVLDKEDRPVKAVVVSSAIKQDNPELIAARKLKIPVVRRAEMLAELMRLKWAIAVAGTHGKTTTTSMIGTMLEVGGFDPTVVNGGIVNNYGTNVRLGNSDWMVVEADESDGTFTRLPATIAVVTNIDPEHMEHYGSFDNLRLAFKRFVENLPFYGFAILCNDHLEVQSLIAELTDRRVITYGFNPQSDIRAVNIRGCKEGSIFDVIVKSFDDKNDERQIKDIFLPMFGDHNIQNSLAAIAAGVEMGIKDPLIKKALGEFAGVKRRFTKTGEVNSVTFIDDYAHHPTEIEAVLKAARRAVEQSEGNIIAIVQPHRYTRLNDLFEEFSKCFNDADTVIVSEVYAAGEDPIAGVDKQALADNIIAHGHKSVYCLDEVKNLPKLIAEISKPSDYVLFMGAGDITKWANEMPSLIEGYCEQADKQRA